MIQRRRVFDRVIRLDDVPDGCRAVDERQAIKVMVRPCGDLALAVAPHSKPLPSDARRDVGAGSYPYPAWRKKAL